MGSDLRFTATRQATIDDHVRQLLLEEFGKSFTLHEVAGVVFATKAPTQDHVGSVYAALGRLIEACAVRRRARGSRREA